MSVKVDLNAHISSALLCVCKKSNHVINIRLTALLDIAKRIARSSIGNAHLDLTKVKNNSSSKFKMLDRTSYLMNPIAGWMFPFNIVYKNYKKFITSETSVKFKVGFIVFAPVNWKLWLKNFTFWIMYNFLNMNVFPFSTFLSSRLFI